MSEGKNNTANSSPKSTEVDRRTFIKMFAATSGAIALVNLSSIVRSLSGPVEVPPWPKVLIANAKDLKVGKAVVFYYPLTTTPNLLVKVGESVDAGVGPDHDIIAFSQICQHQGCFVQYADGQAKCPCHAAIYDVLHGAKVLSGPALYPLPFVKLEYDSSTGDIYAIKMTSPVVYGYGATGSSDADIVLVGGDLVS